MHQSIAALARRNYSALMSAMLSITQARVAELAGLSETQVSRMKGDELERMCAIFAACNLVVLPRSYQSIDPEHKRALEVLARMALDAGIDGCPPRAADTRGEA